KLAVPLTVRADPGAWTIPWALTVRPFRVRLGRTMEALSNRTVKSVTVAPNVNWPNVAWKSAFRTATVAKLGPANTTPPGNRLRAVLRAMRVPVVTVNVAAPAPFSWAKAPDWEMLPVGAVAENVPRPRLQAPRFSGPTPTMATG